ncbi:MAG: anion transporter [Caldilineaceae bacterium]
MPWLDTATLTIIAVTIIGVALGRYPFLRMNRATISLAGATLLLAVGALSLDEAYGLLDLNTLTLLFAMMILNVNLRLAGFFELVGSRVVKLARTPRQLLAWIILASGVLSAIFLNDTIVLIFTPLVVEICLRLGQPAVPYLIGLATAANIGSTATITGNPQNMIIGIASGISFVDFAAALTPVAIGGVVIAWTVIVLVYRREISNQPFAHTSSIEVKTQPALLRKCAAATALMLVAFVTGVDIPLAALVAAGLLLVTRRWEPERIFAEIDWSLLVFFAGLFIVTGTLEVRGLSAQLFALLQPLAEQGIVALSAVAVALSNLISNVPAVLLFRPFVSTFPDPRQTWLALAMSTTLAGNLTLLGSVANLIVAELARRRGWNYPLGSTRAARR